MAVLLVSAGLTHVTAGSTAKLVLCSWPRIALPLMTHSVFLCLLSLEDYSGLLHMVVVSGITRTGAKAQVWDTHIVSNSLHW